MTLCRGLSQLEDTKSSVLSVKTEFMRGNYHGDWPSMLIGCFLSDHSWSY